MALSALDAARALRDATLPLTVPLEGVPYVANPLGYAWEAHRAYVERMAPPGATVDALWVGMNPGPWGMAQTGVPFGCVPRVRGFLGIEAAVQDPGTTHPSRPIEGFACERVEVSGDRLWGYVQDRCGTAESFAAQAFVATYCPLIWQGPTGANVPADKVRGTPALFEACDAHLRALVSALRPRTVVGIGAWAEGRARRALAGVDVRMGRLLHPSPASPAANRGWAAAADAQLQGLGHGLVAMPAPRPGHPADRAGW